MSTLEGVEVLTRVKVLYNNLHLGCYVWIISNIIVTDWLKETIFFQVLDLSFNEFKGPGFEPLENCKVLQVCCIVFNLILPFYVWMMLSYGWDRKVERCEFLFNNSSVKSLTLYAATLSCWKSNHIIGKSPSTS